MAFSYSFHLSSKAHAISTIAKIGQASRHNLRDYKSVDYDKENIHVLIGEEKTILQSMQEIYSDEFDEALKKYNDKQTREDRKIDNYLKHISNAKADVGAEIIIQVGDKDFWEDIDKENWSQLDGLFEKQIDKLKELVPEFKIASAVVHYDESSPHMHIVGVPVAEGFKKGLEKQVSKTKVFTKDRLSSLQDEMRSNVELCMKSYPDIFENKKLKEKEKGRNKDIPKHKLNEYYEMEQKKENLKKEIDQRQVEKDTLESELYSIHANITEVKQDFKAAAKEMPSVDYFMKERDPKKIETVKKKDGTFWQRVGFDFKVILKMQNWIKKYILPLREKEKQIDKRIEYVQERSKSVLADIKAKGTRSTKTASKQAERSKKGHER